MISRWLPRRLTFTTAGPTPTQDPGSLQDGWTLYSMSAPPEPVDLGPVPIGSFFALRTLRARTALGQGLVDLLVPFGGGLWRALGTSFFMRSITIRDRGRHIEYVDGVQQKIVDDLFAR